MSFIDKYTKLNTAVAKAETEAKEAEASAASADAEVIRLKADKAAGENVTAAKITKAMDKRATLKAEVSDLKGVALNLKARLVEFGRDVTGEVEATRKEFIEMAETLFTERMTRIDAVMLGAAQEDVSLLVGQLRLIERLSGRHGLSINGISVRSAAHAAKYIFVSGALPIALDDGISKDEGYTAKLGDAVGFDGLETLVALNGKLIDLSMLVRSQPQAVHESESQDRRISTIQHAEVPDAEKMDRLAEDALAIERATAKDERNRLLEVGRNSVLQ